MSGAPRLFFTKDSACFLPWLREIEADAYAIDWRLDIDRARAVLGDVPVQGNLDPQILVAGGAVLDAAVDAILEDFADRRFIFNLGHGILPETPPEHVTQLVARVRKAS